MYYPSRRLIYSKQCSYTQTNVRETRRGNQDWTLKRHRQQWTHKTGRKQNNQHNIENCKKISNTDPTQLVYKLLAMQSVTDLTTK